MLVRGSIRTRSTGSPHAWWGGDAAEDLAQDAFLKAWQEIGDFAGEAAFGTWLYRIATNLCLDHLRMTAAHPRAGGPAGRLPALRVYAGSIHSFAVGPTVVLHYQAENGSATWDLRSWSRGRR